ncbi:MAG TPA: AMP-binding protein [Kofleriaceae bacterium]|nr:AMP-binding protein [Kofleriaceae bacterium]
MTARDHFLAVVRKHAYPGPEGPALWSAACEAPSRARLRTIQEEKLAAGFDYLFESSAFYRHRFELAGLRRGSVRSLDDLRRVPVTRKLDWMPDIEAHPPWGTFSPLSEQRWRASPWMVFSTSGTTRRPRLFRHTTHDRDIWAWMNARALWSYGVRPGEVALNCFYYGASVAAWGLHEGLLRLGCPVVPGGAMPPERRAAVVVHVRPAVLLGTPSGLLTLGRRVQEQGDDPAAQGVRTLVCAGEPGAAIGPTRRRLQALWGAQVHDDFGCTEIAMAPLGYTCQAEAGKRDGEIGVHLMEDALIVEVLDPETLEPVPVGQRGTLVVSNLYSEAVPFLRFDMGDWVRLRDDPCACGRTHVRAVGGLLGRNDHCLKIKGLQFFPSTFEDAIRSIDGLGDEYRVDVLASSEPDRDDVEIVVERGPGPGAALTASHVASRLRGILGITVVVSLVEPGTLPRSDGKGIRFVDRRAAAAG